MAGAPLRRRGLSLICAVSLPAGALFARAWTFGRAALRAALASNGPPPRTLRAPRPTRSVVPLALALLGGCRASELDVTFQGVVVGADSACTSRFVATHWDMREIWDATDRGLVVEARPTLLLRTSTGETAQEAVMTRIPDDSESLWKWRWQGVFRLEELPPGACLEVTAPGCDSIRWSMPERLFNGRRILERFVLRKRSGPPGDLQARPAREPPTARGR